MTSFRAVRSKCNLEGFHGHHLISCQVVEARSFARFFGSLRSEGFEPDNFETNGIHLPSTEVNAMAFALPMHRGPHLRYNAMVAHHIAALERLTPREALHQIHLLQIELRDGLRMHQRSLVDLVSFTDQPHLIREFDTIEQIADRLAFIPRRL